MFIYGIFFFLHYCCVLRIVIISQEIVWFKFIAFPILLGKKIRPKFEGIHIRVTNLLFIWLKLMSPSLATFAP